MSEPVVPVRPEEGPPPTDADGSAPDTLSTTERTRLRRFPDQGSHRPADLYAVLDAGFVCHLGIVVDGSPMVVPTSYGRDGDVLYLHGSVASRSLRAAKQSVEACVTVTHIDGVVLARSVFEHAINYRCAMVYGTPEVLTDLEQKRRGLRAISDQVAPGQWGYARMPTDEELAVTTVLRMTLDECSVKIRRGPPHDGDLPDAELDIWAGELPLRMVRLDLVADPTLRSGIPAPGHLSNGRPAPGTASVADVIHGQPERA